MFAIAFDLTVEDTLLHHSRGLTRAYADIRRVLSARGFEWTPGSVYLTKHEDLTGVVRAMNALKALPWFPRCVRDVRAFRVEQWSDFTDFMKS